MTIEQAPQDEINEQVQKTPEEASSFAGESRRRFTRAGFAASGVLMTLASRSSLASLAVSPSGFTSANQSTHGQAAPSEGLSPNNWSCKTNWPARLTPNSLFRNIFSGVGSSSAYYNATLGQLLEGQSYDTNGVGKYLVAAYLNAMAGYTPFLTTSTLLNMWTEYSSSGEFKPTATVSWKAAQIVTYLQATQS